MLTNIADIVYDPIIYLDKNLVFKYWNEAAQSEFGISKDDILGQKLFSIFPQLKKQLQYYFEVRVFKEKGDIEIQNLEIKLPKSKMVKYFNVRLKYTIDKQQNPLVIILLKRISSLTYDAEYINLINAVIKNTKDAVLVTNVDPADSPTSLKIIFANPAFFLMTGYEPHEILGKSPRILQGEKTSQETTKAIREAIDKWEPIQVELVNYKKDGSEFWVDLSIFPIKNEEGWYRYWVAIQRETTLRKRLENHLRAHNQDLEKLIASRTKDLEELDKKKREEEIHHMNVKAELNRVKLESTINELSLKKQKLIIQEMKISEKTIFVKRIKDELANIKIEKKTPHEITKLIRFIERENIESQDWNNFVSHFEDLHKDFFTQLNKLSKTPLSSYSKKHCAFIKLGLTSNEVASILHIESKSVDMARYRIKKKLGLTSDKNLQEVIQSLD